LVRFKRISAESRIGWTEAARFNLVLEF
jgi:hypothetical protein